ncbi:acyltransferase [Aureimonas sp. Leaf454]|uniref:acyltransferase family protein n=1 Tax=Aureimonas sp. Leaf454 TaxID=1736381 RepID=UPI0009E8DCFE
MRHVQALRSGCLGPSVGRKRNMDEAAVLRSAPLPRDRAVSLQWLRLVAAAMVVLYHAAVYLQIMKGSTWGTELVPGWFGAVGVGLFFALSGYLMSRIMTTTSFQDFILHRIIRIYPTFFLATILFLGLGTIAGLSPIWDWRSWTLMPSGPASYALGVEWTLVFEMMFYVFVGLLILFKKQGSAITVLIAWLLVMNLHNVYRPDDPSINLFHPFGLPFVSLNVAFAAGMLLPLVLKTHVPHPVIAILIGLNTFYIGAHFGTVPVRWGIGIGAGLIVLSLASWQYDGNLPGQRILDRIGDRGGSYTYALYLIHVPIIRMVYVQSDGQDPRFLFWLVVVVSFASSIPFGMLDNYLYRQLKKRSDRASSPVKSSLAFGFVAVFLVYSVLAGIAL